MGPNSILGRLSDEQTWKELELGLPDTHTHAHTRTFTQSQSYGSNPSMRQWDLEPRGGRKDGRAAVTLGHISQMDSDLHASGYGR